jgi:hypothetical protein
MEFSVVKSPFSSLSSKNDFRYALSGHLKPMGSSGVSKSSDDVWNAVQGINGIGILHCSGEKQFCLPLTSHGPAELA